MTSRSVNPSFNDAETSALLRAAPNPWWSAFLHTSVHAGLRTTETLRLHWSDFDAGTCTVRVTSRPIPNPERLDRITLRTQMPPHCERFVPVDPSVFAAVEALRRERPDALHVFVSDWRLDQLWTYVVREERIDTRALAPWINDQFGVVQRLARHGLALERQQPLETVAWKPRPLTALRDTYAVRAARSVSPSTLAAVLGLGHTSAVLKYFDFAAISAGGTT